MGLSGRGGSYTKTDPRFPPLVGRFQPSTGRGMRADEPNREVTVGSAIVKHRQSQLTEEELMQGFSRLVSNEWRFGDAKVFLRRIKSTPSISAPYLINHLVNGTARERETATMMLRLLAGPRVIMPLREVLRSETISDDARIAAALVLEELGEKVDVPGIASGLRDPRGVFDAIWETVLSRSQSDETFLVTLLQSMQEGPSDGREEVIRALGEPRDPRALWILKPLLYGKRVGTILAAIDAIEAIGGTEAVEDLKAVSENDPSRRVRKRARVAYGRLLMRSRSFFPDPPTLLSSRRPLVSAYPVQRAWVTFVDSHGDQAVGIVRRRPDGLLKVLSILVSETQGITRCLGVDEMQPSDLAEIEEDLRARGLVPVDVDIHACQSVLADARALNVACGRRLPTDYEIWKGMLGNPSPGSPKGLAGAATDTEPGLLSLLPETVSLLAGQEFRHWVLDPDLVWPYVDEWSSASAEDRAGLAGQATLEKLVALAAHDLIDQDYRRLLSRRLNRQAWLLARLGKQHESRLATAAALGLDPEMGIPLDVHPFVRAMVTNSFLNAGLCPPRVALAADGHI